jgi:hypothetical protein
LALLAPELLSFVAFCKIPRFFSRIRAIRAIRGSSLLFDRGFGTSRQRVFRRQALRPGVTATGLRHEAGRRQVSGCHTIRNPKK